MHRHVEPELGDHTCRRVRRPSHPLRRTHNEVYARTELCSSSASVSGSRSSATPVRPGELEASEGTSKFDLLKTQKSERRPGGRTNWQLTPPIVSWSRLRRNRVAGRMLLDPKLRGDEEHRRPEHEARQATRLLLAAISAVPSVYNPVSSESTRVRSSSDLSQASCRQPRRRETDFFSATIARRRVRGARRVPAESASASCSTLTGSTACSAEDPRACARLRPPRSTLESHPRRADAVSVRDTHTDAAVVRRSDKGEIRGDEHDAGPSEHAVEDERTVRGAAATMALPLHTGEPKPRSRRPSPLRLRSSNTSPQLTVHSDGSAGLSPTSPIFYSPTLQVSPASATASHFSQLPPSPPLAGGEWTKQHPEYAAATTFYPTPPASESGRLGGRSPGSDTREQHSL